ncbi:hypothetical protein HC891_16010, partial [Candidatus Gracilibacteria bacterium]|nr:hypothetical protein [Candidatus Gracilibacteria bacterium]
MTIPNSPFRRPHPLILLALVLLATASTAFLLHARAAQGQAYYVAPDGNNSSGDGSVERPWATITHAVNSVPDGSTILVEPGTYVGEVRLDRIFTTGITISSQTPYQAKLRNLPGEKGVRSFCGRAITLEGFDIAHEGANPIDNLVHIQATDGVDATSGAPCATREITVRGNIIHDSLNNDLLKINNGAQQITVTGNLFYNQRGSDEHIDINSVINVVVQDNIFLNDPDNGTQPHAFIVVKDSNDNDDGLTGTRDITLRRNVFLGWAGSVGYGFIQIGEDGKPYYEAQNVLVENNLLLHHSVNQMNAPFAVMGSRDVTIRNNTFVGDGPTGAWLRVYRFDQNQPAENVRFFNNIWSRPPVASTASRARRRARSAVTRSTAISTGMVANPSPLMRTRRSMSTMMGAPCWTTPRCRAYLASCRRSGMRGKAASPMAQRASRAPLPTWGAATAPCRTAARPA